MGRRTNLSRRKKKKIVQRRIVLSAMGSVLILIILYIGLSLYYNNHFYKNTEINGVNCSNKTVEAAKTLISSEVNDYVLTIALRDNKNAAITGKEIGLELILGDYIENLKDKQNGFAWIFDIGKSHNYDIEVMLDYNEGLLEQYYNELECFSEGSIIKPQDAYISEYSDGAYHIVEEEKGTLIDKDKLYELVKESVYRLEDVINIEENGLYIEPDIKSDSDELLKAVNVLNKYVSSEITYKFGDATEVLNGDIINEWLSVDEELNVTIDDNKVKEFVDYIGKTYNTFGKKRPFKTSYNKTITIEGGDYGWWLDRTTEKSELIELIKNGEQLVKEPAYFQKAVSYGEDDIGDTYVEINITAQHLFLYKDGKLVIESDFVSGNISRDYYTPSGAYSITYKTTDSVLVGEDYETPVAYWMPFNGNIGMHDAVWRRDFGRDIYLTGGSHGCVNLPPSVAKTIYENINKGTPVLVYELEGTENYTVTQAHLSIFEAARKRAEEKALKEEQEKNTGAQSGLTQ